MLHLFNNNLSIDVRKHATSTVLYVYLLKKIGIFFEFDSDCGTIKFLPKLQTRKTTKLIVQRLMFLWFSLGIILIQEQGRTCNG